MGAARVKGSAPSYIEFGKLVKNMTEREVIEVLKNFDLQVKAKADGVYQTNPSKLACGLAISVIGKIIPKPLEEWCEEYGDCLWWHFPIEESPYCGSPLDSDWEYVNRDNYYTHFTEFVDPKLEEN